MKCRFDGTCQVVVGLAVCRKMRSKEPCNNVRPLSTSQNVPAWKISLVRALLKELKGIQAQELVLKMLPLLE